MEKFFLFFCVRKLFFSQLLTYFTILKERNSHFNNLAEVLLLIFLSFLLDFFDEKYTHRNLWNSTKKNIYILNQELENYLVCCIYLLISNLTSKCDLYHFMSLSLNLLLINGFFLLKFLRKTTA